MFGQRPPKSDFYAMRRPGRPPRVVKEKRIGPAVVSQGESFFVAGTCYRITERCDIEVLVIAALPKGAEACEKRLQIKFPGGGGEVCDDMSPEKALARELSQEIGGGDTFSIEPYDLFHEEVERDSETDGPHRKLFYLVRFKGPLRWGVDLEEQDSTISPPTWVEVGCLTKYIFRNHERALTSLLYAVLHKRKQNFDHRYHALLERYGRFLTRGMIPG